MNYAGWQRVEKDAPMKPFLVVKAFSSRSHHHTKRASNDDFSLPRLHHHHHFPHNHTTAAGIAALAANALFAGNVTLPANAAFTRRQRLRWAQTPPPSPSPPATPPTNDSTNPSPHRLRRNRHDYDKSGGRRYRGSVDEERVLLGDRKCYGRGGARRRYRRGRRQARGGERRMTTLGGAEALRRGVSDGRREGKLFQSLPSPHQQPPSPTTNFPFQC